MFDRMIKDSLLESRARLNRELYLGRGKHTGRFYFAALADYLATHIHLIGASNFGKSFFLEHVLRALTDVAIPASLIDPHGDRARSYHAFLQRRPRLMRERRVLHLAPGVPGAPLGLNPFDCGLDDPGEVASLVLEAVLRAFGQESSDATPQLERVLRIKFHVFAANQLPLTESGQFLAAENRSFRQNLLARVADEQVRLNWREIECLPLSEKRQVLLSSWNRLQRLLAFGSVQRLFAAESGSVNFADVFAKKQVLVADLSRLPSKESQTVVGTILVNALYNAAKRRPESRRSLHFVGIDEFPQFVTSDVARSLDELRKFGIRLLLAHQRLAQLPDDLRSAVLTNAQIKAVFGGLTREDAEIIARELFTGEVSGNRVKHITRQTKFRPILTERDVESFSEATSDGSSSSDGWSDGSSSGTSQTDETLTNLLSSSSGWSNASGSSHSSAQGHSWSTAFVTEHAEFQEETSRQFLPLEEQWEVLVARIKNLDRREALIKIFNRPVLDIATPDLKEYRPLPRRRKAGAENPKTQAESAGPIAGTLLPPQSEGELPEEDYHD
jgi:hypothetical protein